MTHGKTDLRPKINSISETSGGSEHPTTGTMSQRIEISTESRTLMKDRVLELTGKMNHAGTLTHAVNPTLERREQSPLGTNVVQYEKEVVTPIKEFASRPLLDITNSMHAGFKEINLDIKNTRKNMASPKELLSWIKHKIYNTQSKVATDKDQVSSRGLASDKVANVTLGKRSHIEKAKSQAEVDIKNGKQATIGGALRAGQA